VWGRNLHLDDLGKDDENPDDDSLQLSDFICSDYMGDLLEHDPAGDFADDLKAYEWIAEGHWCMRLVRSTLPPRLMTAVDAVFTVPATYELEQRKHQAREDLISRVMRAGTYGNPPEKFVLAVVTDWMYAYDFDPGPTDLDPGAWAKELAVSVKTLHRYRYGRGRWGRGINPMLDDLLLDAVDLLKPAMRARGLIPSGYRGPRQ
jgi:hypothetical protein